MKGILNFFGKNKQRDISNDAPPNDVVIDYTPLFEALRLCDENEIKKALGTGISVNASNEDGDTALHQAFRSGVEAPQLLSTLLEYGADPNQKNHEGDTPLHLAIGSDRPDSIALLIDKGADPNQKNRQGDTPLHLAIGFGLPDSVARLLEKGADPNILNSTNKTTLQNVRVGEKAYGYDVQFLLIEAGAIATQQDTDIDEVQKFDTALKEALDSPNSSEKLKNLKLELVKSHETEKFNFTNGDKGEIQQWDRFTRAQSLFDNKSVATNKDNYESVMLQFEYMRPGYGGRGEEWHVIAPDTRTNSEIRELASVTTGIDIAKDKDIVSYGKTKEGNSWVSYVKEDNKKGMMIEF